MISSSIISILMNVFGLLLLISINIIKLIISQMIYPKIFSLSILNIITIIDLFIILNYYFLILLQKIKLYYIIKREIQVPPNHSFHLKKNIIYTFIHNIRYNHFYILYLSFFISYIYHFLYLIFIIFYILYYYLYTQLYLIICFLLLYRLTFFYWLWYYFFFLFHFIFLYTT